MGGIVYTSSTVLNASLSYVFGTHLILTTETLYNGIEIQSSRFRSWGCIIGLGPSQRRCLVPGAVSDHHEFHSLA